MTTIIDDSIPGVGSPSPGFTRGSGWSLYSGGYGSLHTYGAALASTCLWSWTGLAAGRYRVSITWPSQADNATPVYSVSDGSGSVLATASVDQTQSPSGGLVDQGWTFQAVADVSLAATGSIRLEIHCGPSGYTRADAAALESIGPPPPPPPPPGTVARPHRMVPRRRLR